MHDHEWLVAGAVSRAEVLLDVELRRLRELARQVLRDELGKSAGVRLEPPHIRSITQSDSPVWTSISSASRAI